jgi:hypothetical protein
VAVAPAPGIGVDAQGGPVVDPTENVRQLVLAESKYQDAMRSAEARYQNDMRLSESRRLDDLAELRVKYEARISEVLTVQVKTTSELISTQLDKVTTALGQQITSSVNSLLERIGQLERFRWEVGGKTSVQDPALSAAMSQMATAITALQVARDNGEGRTTGRSEMVAWAVAAAAIGGTIVAMLRMHT